MPYWMPSLRETLGGESKALFNTEVPVAFSAYYNDLAAYNVHRRARHWPIERAITEGYERVIWCFKSVNSIATDHARLPFVLRQGDEIVDDHPLYRVLNKQANPLESGKVFRKRLSAQISLSKKGVFVERTISNGGTIKRLDLLPPDRTEIIPASDGGIDHYRLTRRNGTIRNIDPDKVKWFRDPHPTDPWSGVTPLEAAGMSVELDHFARLYNVSFMQNDGRPGGVLAVRDTKGGTADMDPAQMDRIEEKFAKGPVQAGKLSVIAGDLSYVDVAAKPRDMQYGATSRNAKIEILSAFGVGESVLGYAAERTFDNADNELYVYWTRTMPGHNDIIVSGFDDDSEDDLEGFLDVSGIEVLERHEKARREEARTEVEKGLRSPYSYAMLAGYEKEIDDTPHTRALYIPSGKTPLPTKVEDYPIFALPLEAPEEEPEPAPGEVEAGTAPQALPPGGEPGSGASGPVPPAAPGAPAAPTAGADEEGIDTAALAAKALTIPGRRLHALGSPRTRYEVRVDRKAMPEQWAESDPDIAAADKVEAQIAVALSVLSERWIERAAARIASPKQRKSTRHWTPEYDRDTRVGTKALDAAKAVDEQTWEAEAEQAVNPIVTAAAVAAAVAMFTDIGLTPPPGETLTDVARRAVEGTRATVVRFVGASAARMARGLIGAVNDSDQNGNSIADILDQVRGTVAAMGQWARGLATQAATATVNGARDDAAVEAVTVPDDPEGITTPAYVEINRVWFSRRDAQVRHTHAPLTGADGQVRELYEPFIVGDSLVRFPGDTRAPLKEVAGCRCHLRYRFKRSGRFAAKPGDADALAQ